jgi:hypothetical protein
MNNQLSAVSLEPTEISAGDQERAHVPPLFVVGMWRSGTTLLYALLNQHPDIRLFYESDIALLWPMFRVPWSRRVWAQKWDYWNAGASRHDFDLNRLATPARSLAEALEVAGREYCRPKGANIWGCKSPSYYDRMVWLARQFPGARFIVIWRDPEEICSSILKAASGSLWFARRGMTLRAIVGSETLKRQCDGLQSMGVPLHQLHYRDLVEDPSATMRGICEFLGVPFNPAVASLEGADRSAVITPWGAHHALASGNRIIAQRESKGALPQALADKIRRYKALWKAEKGDWLLCKHFQEVGETKPGFWERASDRLRVRVFRLADLLPGLVYSALPTRVWQAYRRLKYKDAQYVHSKVTKKHAISSK